MEGEVCYLCEGVVCYEILVVGMKSVVDFCDLSGEWVVGVVLCKFCFEC